MRNTKRDRKYANIMSHVLSKIFKRDRFVQGVSAEFNKSSGPAGHQVRILWGPTEIYTLPVQISDTIFLQYWVNISFFQVKHV